MVKRFYTVIKSEDGKGGYPRKFDTMAEAQSYYDDCEKGAILVLWSGRHESVLKSKGLSESEVISLMGW